MENAIAFEIACAFLARFGGDTIDQLRAHVEADAARQRTPGTPGTPGTSDRRW
jgi:hypothetical protein